MQDVGLHPVCNFSLSALNKDRLVLKYSVISQKVIEFAKQMISDRLLKADWFYSWMSSCEQSQFLVCNSRCKSH